MMMMMRMMEEWGETYLIEFFVHHIFSKSDSKYGVPELRKKTTHGGSQGKKESKTHAYILSVLKFIQEMA